MEADHLLLERAPPIQRITLNRPDRLNALATQTWAELRDALREADEDDEIRVIVLGGEGRAFCSGDDIADFEFETTADARAYARHIMSCGLTIERIETPVISSVHGLAHGGGCEIAALADVTIASEERRSGFPKRSSVPSPASASFAFPNSSVSNGRANSC